MVLNQGRSCPRPADIWQRLSSFLVVMTGMGNHKEAVALRSTGLRLRNLEYSDCKARLSVSQGQCEGKGGGETRKPGRTARSEGRERRSCRSSRQKSRTQVSQPRWTWL